MYKTDYVPDEQQGRQLALLVKLCTAAIKNEVKISIFGGYGVDGLVGVLTRDHHDIDILVHGPELVELSSILLQLDFSLSRENESKQVYKNINYGENFQIEILKQVRLDEFITLGEKEIFPDFPNARLGDIEFVTPTIVGHSHIHDIQSKRAIIKGWPNYRHEKSRDELVRYIKGSFLP